MILKVFSDLNDSVILDAHYTIHQICNSLNVEHDNTIEEYAIVLLFFWKISWLILCSSKLEYK